MPYLNGKDPMEIVHDRERKRYSKHISRTFTRGTYYLEVNANHPDYILRHPRSSRAAVQRTVAGGGGGDALHHERGRRLVCPGAAQGNIYVRSGNMHDTATRCTACHPSSFSTEANLTAHRNGYEIRSKSNFQYVIDRLYNSNTPLYGGDGLYWQRFIGIPLQAQGKQGSILLDFERQVSGKKTRTVERFGPFLARAWESRRSCRPTSRTEWSRLTASSASPGATGECFPSWPRRTGRADFAKAAATISNIVGDRAADRRIETMQDRIHRLYAWWLLDKTAFASKIKRETKRLITLQNADGGWHESDSGAGPSAVYTTGQLAWTLLRIGVPRDHPALEKALRYLLVAAAGFRRVVPDDDA